MVGALTARPGAADPPARRRPRRPRLRRPLVGRDPGAGPPRGRLPLRLLLRRRRPARPVPAGHRRWPGPRNGCGVRIVERTRVTRLESRPGHVRAHVPGGVISADRVLLTVDGYAAGTQPASLLGGAGADARGRHGPAVARRAGQPRLGRCRRRDRPAQLLRLLPAGSRRPADLRRWAGALPDRRPAPRRARVERRLRGGRATPAHRASRGCERCPSRPAGRGSPAERWTGFPWSGRCGTIRACTSQAGGAGTVWRCASTPPSGTPRCWPSVGGRSSPRLGHAALTGLPALVPERHRRPARPRGSARSPCRRTCALMDWQDRLSLSGDPSATAPPRALDHRRSPHPPRPHEESRMTKPTTCD